MSVEDAFFAWLVEHACDLINRFNVRKMGKGPMGRVKIWTRVWHRTSGPVSGGVVQERWHDGIWLGLQFTYGEHFVALTN